MALPADTTLAEACDVTVAHSQNGAGEYILFIDGRIGFLVIAENGRITRQDGLEAMGRSV